MPIAGPSIILVDPDEAVLEVLTDVLRRREATVFTATKPCDATRLILEGLRPDVVVTEFILPDMHGVALINELRATVPKLPAIVLTTGAEAFPESFLRRGIRVLQKPCTPDALWAAIDAALATQAAAN